MPKVQELMKHPVITVPARSPVRDVIELFEEKMIAGAPVVDARGAMLGMVSRTDITSHMARNPNVMSSRVEEIMTPFVFRVTPEDSVLQLLDIMLSAHIHRIVVTEGDHPVGIVTTMDLMKDYQRLLEALAPPKV